MEANSYNTGLYEAKRLSAHAQAHAQPSYIAEYLQEVARRLDDEDTRHDVTAIGYHYADSARTLGTGSGSVSGSAPMMVAPERFQLRRKIVTYNNRVQLEAFGVNFVNRVSSNKVFVCYSTL